MPVPPKLVRGLISKAFAKDPDDRFQNFDDLKDALMGVEPAITKEIKDLLFPQAAAQNFRRKKSLKKTYPHVRMDRCLGCSEHLPG